MKPGPEMDMLVAEKIMGIPSPFCPDTHGSGVVDGTGLWCNGHHGRPFRHRVPWPYSTSDSHALEIPKFLSPYPRQICTVILVTHSDNLNAVMMYEGGAKPYPPRDEFLHLQWVEPNWEEVDRNYPQYRFKKPVRVQAATLAEAICLAALEFFEVEIPV